MIGMQQRVLRMEKKSVQRGFTLLEMVVSLAIIAVVAVVLSQVFIATLRTNVKTEILKDTKQSGEFALESMVRMIQNAKSVASACVSTGTVAKSVSIVNPDGETTTFGCTLVGAETRISSVSAQGTEYLTPGGVTLGGTGCSGSSLSFTCYGAAGLPGSVTISFQLAQSGASAEGFEQSNSSFQTSATMRNSAE